MARSSVFPRPSLGSVRIPVGVYPAAGTLGTLGLLELLARTEVLPSRHFPPVTETFGVLVDEVSEARLWNALGETLQGWALGLGLAAALAVPLAVLIGSSPVLYRSLRAVVEFLRPIPAVALVPLAVLIYGRGIEMKVFLVVVACFWPLLMQTLYGVRDVDPLAMDMARSFRIRRVARLTQVALPSALPYVATGLRIASAVALILAVTAELIVGAAGLGHEIRLAQSGGRVELMYAYIVTTGLVGWMLNTAIASVERRVLRWHPAHREDVT